MVLQQHGCGGRVCLFVVQLHFSLCKSTRSLLQQTVEDAGISSSSIQSPTANLTIWEHCRCSA